MPETMNIPTREYEELQESKNQAYKERNQLVALLSKVFPSVMERHPEDDKDWEDDWRWIVFIDLPTGQASWHIHDSELPLFKHLYVDTKGGGWDGHTTEEKYKRVEAVKASACWFEYHATK